MRPHLAVLLLLLPILLAGCADDAALDEEGSQGDEGLAADASPTPSPVATPSRAASPTPAATVPATATPTPTPTPPPSPGAAEPAPQAIPNVTNGPAGDIDLDGIPDAYETSLGSSCAIAGQTCAALGITAPVVGHRDLVLVQFGRSGTERNWRLPASVWASTRAELANHSIHMQVADLGLRDDIDVEARWEDTSLEGRYWHLWVVYDDPAKAISEETAGSQKYDLITIQDRENEAEMRATILHETYHALLGDLNGGRSACANEEVGGPGHSNDPNSVLYTSPDCESNEGSIYRISSAEAAELRVEPFAVPREMNAPEWFGTVEE